MRQTLITALILLLPISAALAQSEKKSIRRGNRAYSKDDFVESEVQYRKALESNDHSIKGSYNLAASLYKQNKFEEAAEMGASVNSMGLKSQQQADALYNRANALFKQQKFKECADLYKQAVKLNPDDMQARYNLSEALRKLQQHQKQDKGGDKNEQDNQDNKQNQDKQDDQNQDKNKDQNKDDQKNQDNNKDDQNKDQDKQDDQRDGNQQQPQQPKISKEDAERMLNAIQQNDKDIQDRVNAQRQKAAKVKPLKNW